MTVAKPKNFFHRLFDRFGLFELSVVMSSAIRVFATYLFPLKSNIGVFPAKVVSSCLSLRPHFSPG